MHKMLHDMKTRVDGVSIELTPEEASEALTKSLEGERHPIAKPFREERFKAVHPDKEKSLPKSQVRRFPSGAVRSDDRGRIRPDYISPYALEELAEHFSKAESEFGSDKFGTNYFKGIRPIDVQGSIARHYIRLMRGFYPYDPEVIREELRALASNCIMALHQIKIEEMGLYKEPFEKTEYIDK